MSGRLHQHSGCRILIHRRPAGNGVAGLGQGLSCLGFDRLLAGLRLCQGADGRRQGPSCCGSPRSRADHHRRGIGRHGRILRIGHASRERVCAPGRPPGLGCGHRRGLGVPGRVPQGPTGKQRSRTGSLRSGHLGERTGRAERPGLVQRTGAHLDHSPWKIGPRGTAIRDRCLIAADRRPAGTLLHRRVPLLTQGAGGRCWGAPAERVRGPGAVWLAATEVGCAGAGMSRGAGVLVAAGPCDGDLPAGGVWAARATVDGVVDGTLITRGAGTGGNWLVWVFVAGGVVVPLATADGDPDFVSDFGPGTRARVGVSVLTGMSRTIALGSTAVGP